MSIPEIYILLGKNIREKRKALAISSFKLAKKINISQQQLNRYERGVSKISLDRLIKLSDLLDTPVEWFLNKKIE